VEQVVVDRVLIALIKNGHFVNGRLMVMGGGIMQQRSMREWTHGADIHLSVVTISHHVIHLQMRVLVLFHLVDTMELDVNGQMELVVIKLYPE